MNSILPGQEEQPQSTNGDTPESVGRLASFARSLSPEAYVLLSLLIVFFSYQVIGGVLTFLILGAKLNSANAGSVRLITFLGQISFLLIPTFYLVKLRNPEWKWVFKYKMPSLLEVTLVLVSVLALQQLLQGYLLFQDQIPLPSQLEAILESVKQMFEETYKNLVTARSPLEFVAVVIVIAITPAISEELLFRGFVQKTLGQSMSGLKAAIVAGVIFGVFHLNPMSLVALVGLGVFFGFLSYRTDNLLLPIIGHFFNNFIACIALNLGLDDNFVALSPESGDLSNDLILMNMGVAAVVFVLSTYYFIHVTKPATHNE